VDIVLLRCQKILSNQLIVIFDVVFKYLVEVNNLQGCKMNLQKYIVILILIITSNSCSSHKSKTIDSSLSIKSNNKSELVKEIICNETKIQIEKSRFRSNKDNTELYLPMVLDNRDSELRKDIIFESIAFFQGGGDNGLTMPFKPYFTRVMPKKRKKINLVFTLQKNSFPGFLRLGKVNSLKYIQISIEFKCVNSKGVAEEKRYRY